ncbi:MULTISPECIES: hypothetical protein [Pseudomonas]|jgi:hypothetical protein|uniref:Uncharacterized protein n=1 Tax=Pseudomonas mosselii TaxID=78327 RepID=A0A5R8YMD4_9PSED|nr:hypothetical protein [Pseudomonas mosselii]TLP53482.1 hypothetical protein FEM01_23010 [Pseudomonas mosselii]
MFKPVPDPPQFPDTPHYLEDTLAEALEYTQCGLAVGRQSLAFLPRSPATMMLLSVMHELDAVRTLVECALAQVQLKTRRDTCTLH